MTVKVVYFEIGKIQYRKNDSIVQLSKKEEIFENSIEMDGSWNENERWRKDSREKNLSDPKRKTPKKDNERNSR